MLRSGSVRLLIAMVASVIAVGVAAPADAAISATIFGDPLQTRLDGIGGMQVVWATTAGLTVELDGRKPAGVCVLVNLGLPIGPCGNSPTNVTPASVTGSGTEGDPYVLTETWKYSSSASVEVTETLTYVNGDTSVDATYTIKNTAAVAEKFRTLVEGDLEHGGFTLGQGSYDPTPPAALFGFNDERGAYDGLVEGTTPWDSYEEADWAASPLMHASNPAGLSDTVDPDLVDDWIGVAYDQYAVVGLPAGDSTTVNVKWVFGAYAGLTLGASPGTANAGATELITASSFGNGAALVGEPVRYTVTGANPSSGTVFIGPVGSVSFNLLGANAGTDTITAFADANSNNVFDPDSETQRSITVKWAAVAPAGPATPPGPTADQIAAQLHATLKRFGALLRNEPPKVLLRTPAPHGHYQALEAGTLTATLRGQKATASAARASVLATARVPFTAAGTKRVTLHATKKGRKLVRRAKRIKATLTLAFAAPFGAPISRHASIVLKRR